MVYQGTVPFRPKEPVRPVVPGCSIGYDYEAWNVPQVAGTLTAIVRDNEDLFVLSCNHVLAANGFVPLGVPIAQPAPADRRPASNNHIAERDRFVKLRGQSNFVDCALARILMPGLVSPRIPGSSTWLDPQVVDPMEGMRVFKVGKSTGVTRGVIKKVRQTIPRAFAFGMFVFADQVLIEGEDGKPFADAGDSGSLVIEHATNRATALVSGTDLEGLTAACPLARVLDELGVELVVNDQP
jgi:hypothetical protein